MAFPFILLTANIEAVIILTNAAIAKPAFFNFNGSNVVINAKEIARIPTAIAIATIFFASNDS